MEQEGTFMVWQEALMGEKETLMVQEGALMV